MIFGAGNNCQKLFDSVRNVPAVMIADNDLKKHGTVVNSVPVKYAKDIVD